MSLIDRLSGIDLPENVEKLSVNAFHAHLYEMAAGERTRAQIISYFNLTAEEESELDWIIGKYNAQPTAADKEKFVELMRVLFILAEENTPGYSTNADLAARINRV